MKSKQATRRALLSSLLSLLLCCSMLLGTTFAWFTDSVTSTNNIIKSGTLDVTMDWAEGNLDPATAAYKDAATGAIFDYQLWEPGYTEAKHIKIVNNGTLALKYQMRILANGVVSKLADVIDVYYYDEATQLTRANYATGGTKLGTLSEVLNNTSDKALTKNISGHLLANESKLVTIALHMQETADNEYQDLAIGTDFSVQLLATQLTYEKDSFDELYDENSDYASQEKPSAMVSSLTGDELDINFTWGIGGSTANMKLDAGFQFEPTETYAQALASEYANAHADFYVYADNDVAADSLALAGYYHEWCQYNNDNWVALLATDVSAGRAIRLIADGMNGSSTSDRITVPYSEICRYGNDGTGFRCGIVDLDGTNAGTTVTVELRLYKTYPMGECPENHGGHSSANCETGEYITLGIFKYTFGSWTVADSTELAEAINAGVTNIQLADGEYKLPSTDVDAQINISGSRNAVLDLTWGAYLENATLSFDGVSFKTGTGYVTSNGTNYGSDYAALYSKNVTYTNCVFSGPMRLGRDGASFINCTFNNFGNDYVWLYGNTASFEGCAFNTDGKAILVYNDGGSEQPEVSIKNCTFSATKRGYAGAITNQSCAAIEIHNFGNGVALTTSGNVIGHNFSGEWRIKQYDNGGDISVNGVEYTTIALDGKTMTIDAEKNVTVNP